MNDSKSPFMNSVAPGSVLAGKYVIENVIGKGGIGVILAAKHLQLDQRVAIKVLTGEAALDVERVQRFLREAKAAALIQSEHVVRVFDFGSVPTGEPFLVMEHLQGTDLAQVLKKSGALPIDKAVEYLLQSCEGVAEAHALGIIHRDLKPANLFLTRKKDGSPAIKVLDFGASKLTAECKLAASDPSQTHESTLIGSPRYMAPEQLKAAHAVDARVDVYALGATLYELLAGKPAFLAESISLTFTKILWDAPPPLSDIRRDVPAGLEAAILRALAKSPDERFSSVKELAGALAPFAPERAKGVIAQIARIGEAPCVSLAPPPLNAIEERTPALDRAGRVRRWGTAALLAALVGAAVLFLARPGQVALPTPRPGLITTSTPLAQTLPPEAPRVPEKLEPPAPSVVASEEARPAARPHPKKPPRPSPSAPYAQFGARQ